MIAARAALVAFMLACAAPALAVDRTAGADVPKPPASGAPWTDAELAALVAGIDRALDGEPALRGAHAGLYAVDARDGRVLYARAADDAFQPASTLKLLTGSVALDVLSPAFRFRTDVLADGTVAGGTLRGSLVLRGGGDPTLNADDLDAAAAAVAAAGITSVTGGVEIDDAHGELASALPGWSVDDVPYAYAALPSAITFEHNAVRLTVAPGAKAGDRARVTATPLGTVAVPVEGCAPTAHVLVLPYARTGAAGVADTVDVERDRAGCIRVVGTIPAGAPPDVLEAAVPSPAVYAHDAFVAALLRHGVDAAQLRALAGPWPDEFRRAIALGANSRVLWTHESEPLSDLLGDVWIPSDNLGAELLLREVGVARSGAPGTTADGIAAERRWLDALGASVKYDLADGSGLSAYDRMSPRTAVAILRHDWDGPYRDVVLDDLPIAGVRGTLASSFADTPAARRVFAKTGTLSHVAALAGFVATARHGTVIFAFDVDDALGDPAALRALRGRVLSLFAQS